MNTSVSRTILHLSLVLAAAGAPAVHAQDPILSTMAMLSSRALRDDAAVLRQTYEALHPGLYRYNTRADMARRFADLDRALDHDQPVTEAFLAFTRFTASVRCGHSYPNFYNQPRAIIEALTRGSHLLPFRFVWRDKTMVVTADESNEHLLGPGTLVDAVDGIATSEILERMLPLARADGHNDAKRIDSLQIQGTDRFQAFDIYFPLLFPAVGDTIDLTIRTTANAQPTTVRVTGLSRAQRLAAMEHAGSPDSPLGWTLTFPAPDIALMTMPTWAAYNTKWDWKTFVQRSFETLQAQGVSRLIIDLRGNEGGDSVGDEIAAHLIDKPLAGEGIERRTRYRRVPDALRPTLDTWDPSFFDWGESATGPDADGFYRLTRYDDAPEGLLVHPSLPRFRGRVEILVDATNSSATFEFAKLAQTQHLATLVGAPTGGNLRGINGGAFFFLRLPASKIEVDVPLIGQFPKTDMPDRGLIPDIAVVASAANIARHEDVVLHSAIVAR